MIHDLLVKNSVLYIICKDFGDKLWPVWLPDPPFNIPNTISEPKIKDDIV